MTDLNRLFGTITDGGGNRTVNDPTNANDGDSTTRAVRPSFAAGAGVYTTYLQTDLGTARSAGTMVVVYANPTDYYQNVGYSSDGTAWTNASASYTIAGDGITATYTYGTALAQYWRLEHSTTIVGIQFRQALQVATWEITEAAGTAAGTAVAPDPEPGVWLDWNRDGFDDGTGAGEEGNLSRIYPESGGGTAVSDNITADVQSFEWWRGGSYDHVGGAQAGGAIIRIKANVAGKYNPDNTASPLYGKIVPGVPVWIGANSDGSLTSGTVVKGLFAGYVREFVPTVIDGSTAMVEVICDDALASYRRRPVEVTASTTRSQLGVREAVLDYIGEDDDRRSLGREPVQVPISAVSSDNALATLEEINRASGSRHYVAPADTKEDWYAYTVVSRNHLLTSSVSETIDGDNVDAISGYRVTWDTVVNYQKARVEPVTFTPDTFTVWSSDTLPIPLDRTRSRTIWAEFDDYVFDAVLSLNSANGYASGVLTNFGKTAKIVLTTLINDSVTKLDVIGRQVVRGDAQAVIGQDLASQYRYEIAAGSEISSDFLGQPADAQGVVDFIVWKFADPRKRPNIALSSKNATALATILNRDLYDVVGLTIDRLNVAARRFELVGLRGNCDPGGPFYRMQYELQETPNQGSLDLFMVGTSLVESDDIIWI